MSPAADPGWVVVVPVKRGEIAKSRLTEVTPEQRAALARAFPADCVEAALVTDVVCRALVITDDALAAATLTDLGAEVISDAPDAGINPALVHAQEHVRRHYGDRSLVVLSGDLPALRPDELSVALGRAASHPRSCLADHAGDGTTLLTARHGVDLQPGFGAGSRARHVSDGAVDLDPTGLSSLRRDVDTWTDLLDAVRQGVGRHTRTVLETHDLPFR